MLQTRSCHNLIELLETAALEQPLFPLYNFLDKKLMNAHSISCAQLHADARRIAAGLQASLTGQGLVVLLYSAASTADFIKAFFGILLAGCTPLPLRMAGDAGRKELPELCAALNVHVVLGPDDLVKKVAGYPGARVPAANEPPRLIALGSLPDSSAWARPVITSRTFALIRRDSQAVTPGFMAFSHVQVLVCLQRLADDMEVDVGDRMLGWQEAHTMSGLVLQVLLPLYTCSQSFMLDHAQVRRTPAAWLKAINRYRCTISGGPESVLASCAARAGGHDSIPDLSCWRIVYVGGGTFNPTGIRRFIDSLRHRGLSEQALYCHYMAGRCVYLVSGVRGLTTITRNAVEYVCVGYLKDLDDAGGILPCGAGEVLLPPDCTGSLLTNTRIGAAPVQAPNLSAGQSTGDLACASKDKFYLLGRQENLFDINGNRVQAESLEALILQRYCGLGISRCVAIYNESADELVMLAECVRRRAAEAWGGMVTDIIADLEQMLTVFRVRVLLLRPLSLPVSDQGYIQRAICRDLISSGNIMTRLQPVRGKKLTTDQSRFNLHGGED